MLKVISFIFLMLYSPFLFSQMVVGTDTLYGNEWINYNQSYYKISVSSDGVYRLTYSDLSDAGLPILSIQGNAFQVFHLGQEIPVFTSSSAIFGNNDYIEFYGQKNRTELEHFLFPSPAEMLNPERSLFTDTSAYFLTWGGSGLRYETITNDLTNLPAKEVSFSEREVKMFSDYWAKKEGTHGEKFSHFDVSEGFSTVLKNQQIHSFTPQAPNLMGDDAQIRIRFTCRGADHHQEIYVNGSLKATDEYNGYAVRDFSFDVPAEELNGAVSIKLKGLPNATNVIDRQRVTLVALTYPRLFDFDNATKFSFDLAGNSEKYLEISNFQHNGTAPLLYDYANAQRFVGVIENGLVKFKLPASSVERKLFLVNAEDGLQNADIQPVSFIDYASANSNYLIISNKRLYDDASGGNPVQTYADYRASVAGGSYNPLIVNIQQIYDQFGYGVQRYPIGIRNFVHFAAKHWDDARFVYLIGKGRNYNKTRTAEQLLDAQSTLFLPTFGSPGGDNLFVTSHFDFVPKLAIGRLSVTSPEEINLYLDKVKSLEVNQNQVGPQTIEALSWKKKVIHLGGGAQPAEKLAIKGYLGTMATTIEASDFCGHTVSFFKDVSDPVQQTVPEQIFSEINSGAALISIFGHSSPGSFDFNIDNPDYYNNAGKYPVMTSLGCYSGDIFTSQKGISERFVLYEEKGAVGFLATTSVGYISTLGSFGNVFYQKLGEQTTIGEGLRNTFLHYSDYGAGSDLRRVTEQFLLNGDPALKIGLADGPDYVMDYNSVDFGQATIPSSQDSITLDLSVINLGKNYSDSVSLKITHVLPNGQVYLEQKFNFFPQGYDTPIHVKWLNPGSSALGQNLLKAEVDYLQEVDEVPQPDAELNNALSGNNGVVGVPFFISDNSVVPVEPQEFAIKNKENITLVASTSNAFAEETKYIIQLDTTELFNSPLKTEKTITQIGGLIKWKPSISWLDTTVYYWRITPDSISPDLGYLWSYSSFITTAEPIVGWNQSHFFQFKKDQFDDLEIKRDKDLEFSENGFFITIKNKVFSVDIPPEYVYNYETAAVSVRPWYYIQSGMAVVVGDQYSGGAWPNSGSEYGSTSTSASRVFPYPTNTLEDRQKMINFLENIIPDGSYVWVFSVLKDSTQNFHPELWADDSLSLGVNLFSVLEDEGATMVRGLEALGSRPYAISYQKGVGVLDEGLAQNIDETIIIESFVPIRNATGALISTNIGPSAEWKTLKWSSFSTESGDSDTLSIWGLNEALTDTTLLFDDVESFEFSLATVDASLYPYLLLKYRLHDDTYRSASDLDFWRVHYVPLPEMAINPNAYLQFHKDSLDFGDVLSLDVAVENLKGLPMDSLLVNLKIIDQNNNTYFTSSKWSPLTAFDVDTLHYEIPTTELSVGEQTLTIEANPTNDQPESFHGNNFGLRGFYVKGDREKPVLDVYFDGVRIVDGDLVSAKPEIRVVLDDENPFFKLADTSLFRMDILYPDQVLRRIYFSDPAVEFDPALSSDNIASITYTAVFLQDGDYELIIEAKDASGNSSGNVNYKISFEVINKKMISNVLPYPNPFSTSTRFAYTLTGDATPDVFKIQILSVDGRVVREITQDEIGPLQIGTHLTDYQWDGRDEYGGRLANGVYLYRVIVKDNDNNQLEHYNTNADSFFEKSFGKIVILR